MSSTSSLVRRHLRPRALEATIRTVADRPAPRRNRRPPREKRFQCEQCEHSFDRPSLLAQHILTHTGEKPHQCPQCEVKRFSRTSNLYRHMRVCKGQRARPVVDVAADSATEDSSAASPQPPSPSADSFFATLEQRMMLPSPTTEIDMPIRGVSPDPDWGPHPLASWKPRSVYRAEPVSPLCAPMPVSSRIPLGSGAGPLLPHTDWTPLTPESPSWLRLPPSDTTLRSSEGLSQVDEHSFESFEAALSLGANADTSLFNAPLYAADELGALFASDFLHAFSSAEASTFSHL